MNAWLGAGLLLSLLLAPALLLASRGDPMERLVGMELAGGVVVLDLLVLSQAFAQSSYLIVPLVLVLLSFAGTLVFTRLLGPRP